MAAGSEFGRRNQERIGANSTLALSQDAGPVGEPQSAQKGQAPAHDGHQ